MDLRPYQVEAAEWLAAHRQGILGDEMGIGKSVELLTGADLAKRKRIVVVTPAVACPHWMHEIEQWYPQWQRVRVRGRSKQLEGLLAQPMLVETPAVVVLNYDILKAHELVLAKWADCLILDESHYVKNKTAARTKAAHVIARGVRSRGGYVWLASGTPMPNRPFELVEQLELIEKLERLGGWRGFVTTFCAGKQNWITVRGGRRQKVWDTTGASNLDLLRNQLDDGIMFRRLRRDVMPDIEVMPPALVPLDIDNAAALKEYQEAENDIVEYVWQRTLELAMKSDDYVDIDAAVAKVLAAQHLVELSHLRRLIGECKVEPTKEWIQEWLEGGNDQKLVVFAHHRKVVEEIAACFPSAVLVGGMADHERTEAVEKFRAKEQGVPIMVASTPAAGIGINLTPCHDVVFVEYEWTSAAHRQATDRCARHGQTDPVSVTYLYAPNTVDDRMAHHIAHQMEVVESVFGSDNDVAAKVMGDFFKQKGTL